MKSFSNNLLLFCTLTVLSIILISCSAKTNYSATKKSYIEKNYEADHDDKKYVSLNKNTMPMIYTSHGLPVIAYETFLEAEAGTMSSIDNLRLKNIILGEIKEKFTVQIAMRLSNNLSDTDKQFMRSKIAGMLKESSNDKFCKFDLAENSNLLCPIVLEISLERFSFDVRNGEPKYCLSQYRNKVRTINPEYLELKGEYEFNIKVLNIRWKEYVEVDLEKTSNISDYYFEKKVREKWFRYRQKEVERIKKELDSTPKYVTNPVLNQYQFIETDYFINLETAFKYRIVDLDHRLIWREDVVGYNDRKILKEFKNIHPDDIGNKINQKITEKDIDESLTTMKEQMLSQVAEVVSDGIKKILYYRGQDYEKLGLAADAWENYYIFSKIKGVSDYELSKAKSFINQDPLNLPFRRTKKSILDRKLPTIEPTKMVHKYRGDPAAAAIQSDDGAKAIRRLDETDSQATQKAKEEQRLRQKRLGEEARTHRKSAETERFLNEHVHFELDKSRLLTEAKRILKHKAKWLMAHPNVSVLVEGHTDERGSNEDNMALGERRARSVKRYLVDLGIAPERLITISYGKKKPLDPGNNEESWAKNRRVQFIIK